MKIRKQDAKAVRAYAEPPLEEPKVEVLEDTVTRLLNPHLGNYGQTTGTWSFTIAGTKRTLKAKIIDEEFLTKYSNGPMHFYQGDKLKVRLKERQIIEGSRTKMEYEIVEVLEYQQAHPSVQGRRSPGKGGNGIRAETGTTANRLRIACYG